MIQGGKLDVSFGNERSKDNSYPKHYQDDSGELLSALRFLIPQRKYDTKLRRYPEEDSSNALERGIIYSYAFGHVVCSKVAGMFGSPKKIQEPSVDNGNYGEDYEIRGWEDGIIKVVIGTVATITVVKDAVKKLGFGGKPSENIDANNRDCWIDNWVD